MELSSKLAEITEDQMKWSYKHCLDHFGFVNKSRGFCLDCGEDFSLDLVNRKRVKCPTCSTSLNIEPTRKTTHKQESYFAIAELVEDFQLVRNFIVYAYYKRGKAVRHHVFEILQYWIQPNGKTVMIGHNHNTQGYCDSWGGDWSIRKDNGRWYYNTGKYRVYPYKYYPKSKFKKEYRKFGINHLLDGLMVQDAIRVVQSNPKAETLLKAGQYSLFSHCGQSMTKINNYWASIKICLRNKYKVYNASDWFDYLHLLRYFGKDLHNAKYVCPKNLKKEHDRLVTKKRAIQKKRDLIEQRKRMVEDQKEYFKQKQPFFGLVFKEKDITIKVLENVQEFMEEGDIHGHCLFTNKYYNKKDSLCFMALVGNKRAETIEVSISRLKVLQARGAHNNPTEHHKAIVSLMERNMGKIKACLQEPKKLPNVKEVQRHSA